ncbi:Neither inactivation nor afterpotential protein G [Daphnia magna]|uniref:Neither inactivation nor afterpotential protein G n=1 Tax=Daphnia magna TaxID=35525 RepID=A0A164ZV96_9CRUS|nr:Neither inactivation nor afterpotential protein G [Daphnia magna]
MKLSWKQGLGVWAATTSCLLLAVWLRYYLTDNGFIKEPNQTYDYIVVGAGTSGCVLAAKLAASNSKVLVIEAGGEPPWYSWIPLVAPILQGSEQYDWRFRTVPQKFAAGALHGNQAFWPQGKMVGGSGQMNFLIHATGSPSDYDSWKVPGWDSHTMKTALDGLTCWTKGIVKPFVARPSFLLDGESEMCRAPVLAEIENSTSCSENAQHFQCPSAAVKLQRVNATEKPLLKAFLDAGRACGHSVSEMDRWSDTGSFMASHNTIDGKAGQRWSTYSSHLMPAMKRYSNLHVLTKSSVTKLVWRRNKVIGIQYLDADGRIKHVKAGKEILLSAGTIKTTQILQQSGIGPPHVLEPLDIPIKADLPVGENLQDHLQVPLFVELNASVSLNIVKMLHPRQFWNYMVHGKGALATSGIEGIATLTKKREDGKPSEPYGMLILFNMGSINADVYTSVANIKKEAFHRWFPKSSSLSQEGFVLISICLHPRSRGHIRIISPDPMHPPEIDPAYLSNDYDVQCSIDTIKQGVELLNTDSFRALGARVHWPTFPECGSKQGIENQRYMECLVRTAALTMYHPAGTATMGHKDDPDAVVDPELRVRGVNGLRVVDASVLPRLPSGPPNSVLVAMAERAADFIINKH